MKLKSNWLYPIFTVLCITAVSGCSTSSPYTKTDSVKIEPQNSKENKVSGESTGKLSNLGCMATFSNASTGQQTTSVQDATANGKNQSIKEVVEPTDQELIDSALEYCQTSSDFLERGDFDS